MGVSCIRQRILAVATLRLKELALKPNANLLANIIHVDKSQEGVSEDKRLIFWFVLFIYVCWDVWCAIRGNLKHVSKISERRIRRTTA